ncbi:MAG: galactonate dehydratase, partial [Gammaproteobacteria bacterium]
TKKIAIICELYNAQMAPHIYCGPVAHAAAAHVAFSSPAFLILETILSDFHSAVLSESLTWEEGYLLPPDRPGLGIELNDEVIAANPYATGGRLHLEMCQTPLSSSNTKTIGEL